MRVAALTEGFFLSLTMQNQNTRVMTERAIVLQAGQEEKFLFSTLLGTVYKKDTRAAVACEETGDEVQDTHIWQVLRV